MTWFTGLAVYFLIWWLVFFMVLPFGPRDTVSKAGVAEGQFPGAPVRPHLVRKILIASVISALLYAGFHWAWETGVISVIPEKPE